MPLSPGSRLGPYEIQSAIGAGGMGEVYRARDTRLDRIVAVKILASHLSSSPELKQRMEREARAISSLNHSRICQLYDIGSQDGTDFLVMEFVEGQTLAERLKSGALPLSEIYKIGSDIAEALAAAHRHGIVHRDLKPGNIMLTPSGAKLMDFGLAKPNPLQASGAATASIPTFTAAPTMSASSPLSPLTAAGSIVGTFQYMSPEQIEGKEADIRSDIFAFGVVLYEMSTGKRPFEGKSQISLASAILEKDPEPISAAKPLTPSSFEHVVTTCLQKNPDERYQAARDVKIALDWIAANRSANATAPDVPLPAKRLGLVDLLLVALGALVVGVLAASLINRPHPAPSIRTVINPPDRAVFNLTGDYGGSPVLSPDGLSIAFTATSSDNKMALYVRPMNTAEARVLPGTEGAIFPFWSPDNRALGFFADGKLKTIDLNSGAPTVICDAPFGRGGAWSPDGTIVFSPNTQAALMRVNASGGTPVPLAGVDKSQHTSHRWPFFLPDGKHFLYLAINHDPSKSADDAIYYASLDGRENRPLLKSHSNAVYGAGHLLFARADQLMAQPFDATSGRLRGDPQSLAKGIVDDVSTWHMAASVASNGLLVFGSGGSADWQLVWLDRNGKVTGTLADKLTNLQSARISPQGDRVALQIDTGTNDVWVLDLARGVRTRLTFGPVANYFPIWSPDGKWIVYASERGGQTHIFRKPSDGSGSEETLLTDNQALAPSDWSRDGKYIVYSRGPVGSWTVWALPLDGERKPFLVVPNSENSFSSGGHLSPDGRWIAYASNQSSIPEVYVTAFRGGQGKWQVSPGGGNQPQWSANGKELYYLDPTFNLYAVPVKQTEAGLQFGAAQTLVSNWSSPQVFYDLTPDGKKILLDRISQQINQSVTVMTNFTASLSK
jgi:serine/threonine protein kinase